MQCFANNNGKRCENIAVDECKHCPLHAKRSSKLYKRYKDACDVATQFQPALMSAHITNNIQQLQKQYSLLQTAYNARLSHRAYAISPECFDEGHNYQLELLLHKIEQCETRLDVCYKLLPPSDLLTCKIQDEVEDEPKQMMLWSQKDFIAKRKEEAAYQKEQIQRARELKRLQNKEMKQDTLQTEMFMTSLLRENSEQHRTKIMHTISSILLRFVNTLLSKYNWHYESWKIDSLQLLYFRLIHHMIIFEVVDKPMHKQCNIPRLKYCTIQLFVEGQTLSSVLKLIPYFQLYEWMFQLGALYHFFYNILEAAYIDCDIHSYTFESCQALLVLEHDEISLTVSSKANIKKFVHLIRDSCEFKEITQHKLSKLRYAQTKRHNLGLTFFKFVRLCTKQNK